MKLLCATLLVVCVSSACATIDPKCVVTCMAPQPPCKERHDAAPQGE